MAVARRIICTDYAVAAVQPQPIEFRLDCVVITRQDYATHTDTYRVSRNIVPHRAKTSVNLRCWVHPSSWIPWSPAPWVKVTDPTREAYRSRLYIAKFGSARSNDVRICKGFGFSPLGCLKVAVLTSPKEVMFLHCLFACMLARLRKKTTKPIFIKFGGKVTHGPRKKTVRFWW